MSKEFIVEFQKRKQELNGKTHTHTYTEIYKREEPLKPKYKFVAKAGYFIMEANKILSLPIKTEQSIPHPRAKRRKANFGLGGAPRKPITGYHIIIPARPTLAEIAIETINKEFVSRLA